MVKRHPPSWNPFVSLQAMDRAHCIDQKRTEYKEQVASTVVQKIDASSTGMSSNTKDILNLLQVSSSAIVSKERARKERYTLT
ncbi:hypothetical protein PsorP6_002203 [Peronosclerospora sorghi]|uniref:Uncharacterized protein n=1 Tax=Peronosclerospora sorghi TaxID=230839 RepID=A0ACC0WVB0_9STRA|nr:hypothetical protein PsorP6_002203 [Peronosclerospora sorghi]